MGVRHAREGDDGAAEARLRGLSRLAIAGGSCRKPDSPARREFHGRLPRPPLLAARPPVAARGEAKGKQARPPRTLIANALTPPCRSPSISEISTSAPTTSTALKPSSPHRGRRRGVRAAGEGGGLVAPFARRGARSEDDRFSEYRRERARLPRAPSRLSSSDIAKACDSSRQARRKSGARGRTNSSPPASSSEQACTRKIFRGRAAALGGLDEARFRIGGWSIKASTPIGRSRARALLKNGTREASARRRAGRRPRLNLRGRRHNARRSRCGQAGING